MEQHFLAILLFFLILLYISNCLYLKLQSIAMDKPHQPDYQLFKKWFLQNGGLYSKISFPYEFPPINYVGVAAQKFIKANQVFLAIPKKLIISVTKVKQSQLAPILAKSEVFNDEQDQEAEFNILTLFLVRHKILGKQSFYYPYLQAVEKAETIIQWSDEDIISMNDPYITIDLVNELRQQFPAIYKQFYQLSLVFSQLFPTPITQFLFMECYALVMTRCFGWGLPETMLVPFADFLNHNCVGVHHYTFNRLLQEKADKKSNQQYVMKRKQIDLSIFGIDNKSQLPISYVRNSRQKFVYQHRNLLPQNNPLLEYNAQSRLASTNTRHQLQHIQKNLLQTTFNIDLYPSSNSQDNDSEQQTPQDFQIKQRLFSKQLKRLSRQEIEHHFEQPKPCANRQFEDDVSFNWWYQMDEKNSYFIVAAHRDLKVGEEVFNSYGRRSNRFLLIWYGFTHFNNKYDSVCFRLWDEKVFNQTGKLIFVKYVSQQTWKQAVKENQGAASNLNITDEYRLKRDNLCYQLMSYLRLRIARQSPTFRPLLSKSLISIYKITNLSLQLQVLEYYSIILSHLAKQYNIHIQRKRLSNKTRDYFAHLLIASNEQIIYNHMKGIEMIKKIVERVRKGEKLSDVYKDKVGVGEQECREDILADVFVENRKFVIGYLRMLDRYLKKSQKKP